MHQNEIRDYIERAPRRRMKVDGRVVNTMHARLKWLAEIAVGTIHTRINRRAGVQDLFRPFGNPVRSAIARHERNELRKLR